MGENPKRAKKEPDPAHFDNPVVKAWLISLISSDDNWQDMRRAVLDRARQRLAKKGISLPSDISEAEEINDAIQNALPFIATRDKPFVTHSELKHWVTTKAAWELIDILRKRKRRRCRPLQNQHAIKDNGPNVRHWECEDYRLNADPMNYWADLLLNAIDRLPEDKRRLFAHYTDPEFNSKYKTEKEYAETVLQIKHPRFCQLRKEAHSDLERILIETNKIPWRDARRISNRFDLFARAVARRMVRSTNTQE